MKGYLYWIIIVVLSFIHLDRLTQLLPWKISFYFISLVVIIFVYFIHKKIILNVKVLGLKWNLSLFLIQLMLLIFYFKINPSLVYIVPMIIFIGLELFRINFAQNLSLLSKENHMLKEEISHLNETFRIVRSERHDFLKHVSALHFMLEKNNFDEVIDYLDELVDGYEETNLSIRGERGIVAGMLHDMYQRAKRIGIEVVYDFDLPLSTLPLSDTEMVKLIGNLLSNSIEAAEEWKKERQEKASITLQFYKRSGLLLLICKNNSLPIPSSILDQLYNTYGNTTKEGDHEGLGTKIINDVVDEYNGFLDFVYKDEEFTVKIKFPAIQ